MATVSEWDYFNRNVQSGLVEGRYMNAAFTMLAAGPPRLAALTDTSDGTDSEGGVADIAFPIGIVQSFNLGQTAQVMRLWEIGSERSYFVRGRTMGQLGLGRIMYHGPSLLRVLYAYLGEGADGENQFDSLYENTAQTKLNTNKTKADSKSEYNSVPGHENLWLDLASDVFSQPIGLLLYMRDSNNDTVGAFYFEYCMISNHGFATDAGGTILTENAAIMYEKMIPIDVSAVDLVASSADISGTVITGDAIGSGM
jgi:hypothetical protein